MFIFLSNRLLLNATTECSHFRRFGNVHVQSLGSAAVLWIDDGFTIFGIKNDLVKIGHRRPGIDDSLICSFEWKIGASNLLVRRRWSGEFALYYSIEGGDLCILSHLKLTRLLGQRFLTRPAIVEPGDNIQLWSSHDRWTARKPEKKGFSIPYTLSRDETVKEVRKLVLRSVAALPNNAALLLSGGIDSAAIAVAACHLGKRFRAFTFSVSGLPMPPKAQDSDLLNARLVANHLDIPLIEVSLLPKQLVRDLPLAVLLCETHRGTIVDPCAAFIATAKQMQRRGYTRIWMGEPADDLFGAPEFVLRFFRGARLRHYLREQIVCNSPNEMAVIQNVFAHYRLSVCYAYWTPKLANLGYNLPLRFRVDRHRFMKVVLREAFRDDLPEEIVWRPKCVPRDATGVRAVFEKVFGKSRDRYRRIFDSLFARKASN